MNISVASKCELCDNGWPVVRPHMAEPRGMLHFTKAGAYLCDNYDSECRHILEPLGYYVFAWWPQMCRNGKVRWLRWLERHSDKTFTLGNRAH